MIGLTDVQTFAEHHKKRSANFGRAVRILNCISTATDTKVASAREKTTRAEALVSKGTDLISISD